MNQNVYWDVIENWNQLFIQKDKKKWSIFFLQIKKYVIIVKARYCISHKKYAINKKILLRKPI